MQASREKRSVFVAQSRVPSRDTTTYRGGFKMELASRGYERISGTWMKWIHSALLVLSHQSIWCSYDIANAKLALRCLLTLQSSKTMLHLLYLIRKEACHLFPHTKNFLICKIRTARVIRNYRLKTVTTFYELLKIFHKLVSQIFWNCDYGSAFIL